MNLFEIMWKLFKFDTFWETKKSKKKCEKNGKTLKCSKNIQDVVNNHMTNLKEKSQ